MARKLIPREFYEQISKRINCDSDKAQFIWREISDMIVEELLLYKVIALPGIGTFSSVTKGGKVAHVPIGNEPENRGKTKEIYIEPYQECKFNSTEFFRDAINGNRATRSQLMRQREEYKRIQLEMEESKKQAEYVERANNAFEEMNAKKAKKVKERKDFNRLSKTKQKELKEHEESYWDDFDEKENNDE